MEGTPLNDSLRRLEKQKDLLADALKERGIGYDPSATNYKHNVLKKLGKKKTNGVQL